MFPQRNRNFLSFRHKKIGEDCQNRNYKSYRCPKFDGDAKQALEIRVERKRNLKLGELGEVSFEMLKLDELGELWNIQVGRVKLGELWNIQVG